MSCILVDAGGTGRVWRMPSERDAYWHALYTPGDVVCSSEEHVLSRWGQHDLPMVAELTQSEAVVGFVREREAQLRVTTPSDRAAAEARAETARRIWPALLAIAQEPPSEDEKLAAELLRARRMATKERVMTDKNATTTAAAGKAADKTPKEKTVAGYPATSKLKFGADKEGKPYGKDNNPKRPGTATHTRFAGYRDGMTIAQALETGLTEADVAHDLKKGFVKVAA